MKTRSSEVVGRTARGLRAWLVGVLLAAVGAASTVDGKAADFVGGDDGDALVGRTERSPALFTTVRPRPDVCAATRVAPFLATAESPRPARRALATRIETAAPDSPRTFRSSEPLPSRAPPAL